MGGGRVLEGVVSFMESYSIFYKNLCYFTLHCPNAIHVLLAESNSKYFRPNKINC